MKRLWPVVLMPILVSCASSLPVYEPRVHVVQAGETLYTIAWRHGLDYRDLARWNRLDNPDLIFVGQRIRLAPAGAGYVASTVPPPPAPPAAPPTRRPPSQPVPAPPPARPPAAPQPTVGTVAQPAWRWPVEGRVVRGFGSADGIGSGIAITGRVGEPVRAAAPGRVVYAGGGLIGYGQLVIIKHNDAYLSAYGHNRRLLVEQGESVQRGQTIAEMGLGPERQPQLHFEIRRNGTPIDPLRELPRR